MDYTNPKSSIRYLIVVVMLLSFTQLPGSGSAAGLLGQVAQRDPECTRNEHVYFNRMGCLIHDALRLGASPEIIHKACLGNRRCLSVLSAELAMARATEATL